LMRMARIFSNFREIRPICVTLAPGGLTAYKILMILSVELYNSHESSWIETLDEDLKGTRDVVVSENSIITGYAVILAKRNLGAGKMSSG